MTTTKPTIEEIKRNRDESSGLTRYFIDLALKNLEDPTKLPNINGAPGYTKRYKKLSFEGIKCAGKDYHIKHLLEANPNMILKPKFKKIFPFEFLNNLRAGGIFGGVPDSLLLAAAYGYDEEYYADKGNEFYVQSRGIYTFFTMESLRLQSETKFGKDEIRDFLFDVITVIGLPDISAYLEVDIETATERSKLRHIKKPNKQIIEGAFLKEQLKLMEEYEYLLKKIPHKLKRLTSQDVHRNIEQLLNL